MLRIIAIVAMSLLTSCASSDDRLVQQLGDGFKTTIAVSQAAIRFRDAQGQWPSRPADVGPFLTDAKTDLANVERIITFRTTSKGLAWIDRRSGEIAFVVANESTAEHPKLITTRE